MNAPTRNFFATALVTLACGSAVVRGAVVPTEAELDDASRWGSTRFAAVGPAPQASRVRLPFSFTYGGRPSAELLARWPVAHSRRNLDADRVEHTLTYTDEATGLQVRCVAVQYQDFPTVEWTVYFTNTGSTNTPILEDILGLNARFVSEGRTDFTLHHHRGTYVRADDFAPLTTVLKPNQPQRFAPPGGRP